MHYDKVIDCEWEYNFMESQNSSFIFKFVRKIYRTILGNGCPFTVIRCILLAIFNKNLVFHFIYAENTYKWLNNFKGKTHKIVVTFHQPINFFQDNQRILFKIQNYVFIFD